MLIFGDSIAYGYGASSPACDLAGRLIAQGLSISRQGIMPNNPSARPGNMACDLGIAMYGNPVHADGTIVQVGTNDTIVKGSLGINDYLNALGALIVWSTCNCKLPQSSSIFSYTGTWHGNTYWPGAPGKYTYTSGSSVEFSFSGKTLYLGSYAQNNITGSWGVYVDNVMMGRYTCGSPNIITAHQQSYAPKLIRIDGLTTGTHTAKMILDDMSGTNPVMYLDFVAGCDDATFKPVYVLNIPPQISAYPPQNIGQLNVDFYNAALHNLAGNGLVQKLWDDGLNVQFCDPVYNTNLDFYNGPLYGDDLHLNDRGYGVAWYDIIRHIR